jgi:CrcB protein
MRLFLLASAGGALGAGARYLVNVGFARAFGPAFPWGTFFVNISGSLAMGLLAGWLLARGGEDAELRVFLATGILGGYTTFSAYSLDAVNLFKSGATGAGIAYVAGSVVLSIAALVAGLALARALFPGAAAA